MSLPNTSSSASHWCKSVIEETVPTLKTTGTVPLSSLWGQQQTNTTNSVNANAWKPPVVSNAASAASAGVKPAGNAISPSVLQFYQQYYGYPSTSSATASTSANIPAISTPAAATR
jgi:hypothetical protein